MFKYFFPKTGGIASSIESHNDASKDDEFTVEDIIRKLHMNIGNNFIEFPLWEEGDFRPHINFWVVLPEKITEKEFSNYSIGVIRKYENELYEKNHKKAINFGINCHSERRILDMVLFCRTDYLLTQVYDLKVMLNIVLEIVNFGKK